MYAEFKARHLAHILRMAETDEEYALWAARESERQMPWLLVNLERKVRQEIARRRAADAAS